MKNIKWEISMKISPHVSNDNSIGAYARSVTISYVGSSIYDYSAINKFDYYGHNTGDRVKVPVTISIFKKLVLYKK